MEHTSTQAPDKRDLFAHLDVMDRAFDVARVEVGRAWDAWTRKRSAREAQRSADPERRGLDLLRRCLRQSEAGAVAAWQRLEAPDRVALLEAAGVELSAEWLVLIVAPRAEGAR